MKRLLATITLVSVCLTVSACKKSEDVSTPLPPDGEKQTEESPNVPISDNAPQDLIKAEKNAKEKAEDASAFIAEHIDLDKYVDPIVYDDADASTMIYLIDAAYVRDHGISGTVSLGEPAVTVALPASHDTLSELGFTAADDSVFSQILSPEEESPTAYLAPGNNDYIGFSVNNRTDTEQPVGELFVDSVTLADANSFLFMEKLSGKSDMEGVASVLGEPDYIGITSDKNGTSVMLQYVNDLSSVFATVLFDGETQRLICLYLSV